MSKRGSQVKCIWKLSTQPFSQRDQYLLSNYALGKEEESGVWVEIDSWKSESSQNMSICGLFNFKTISLHN